MLRVDQGRVLAALDIPGAMAWVNGDVVTAGPREECEAQKELCYLEGARFLELGEIAALTRDWWLDVELQRRFLPAALRRQAEARLRALGHSAPVNLNIIEVSDF